MGELIRFNYTRGVPYTVTEPRTDMGLTAWAREDAKKYKSDEAEAVLGPEVEA